MVEDRMKKYESIISCLPKVLGGTIIVGAISYNLTSMFIELPRVDNSGLFNSGLLSILTGYGMDATNYMKGYFNESLELKYKDKK
ncbi:MAG: hypothetical protein WA139_06185 [Candidatus Aenigmatarchaeota archaeon]